MSKLDDILNKEMIFDTDTGPDLPRTKQQIKDLMLDIASEAAYKLERDSVYLEIKQEIEAL